MHLDNIDAGKRFGLRYGFKDCTGALYIGGFIKEGESKRDFIKVRTKTWEHNIPKIIKTMEKFPQETCVVVVRTIQLEWILLEPITKNTGDALTGLKNLLW